MEGLMDIVVLSAFLLAGAVLPRIRAGARKPFAPPARLVDLGLKLIIWTLLLAMGFRIGNDREIGLLAFTSALFALLGTVAAIVLATGAVEKLSGPRRPDAGHKPDAPTQPDAARQARAQPGRGSGEGGRLVIAHLKAPATLLSFVVAGFLAGIALSGIVEPDVSSLSALILRALLFFIGMQFSLSGFSLKGAFFRPANLLVPAATMVGTFGGGLLLVPLFGIAIGKALALVGGFGWYSLSGVLISDLGDPVLGSASFLSNMVRESAALVCIPFLARTKYPTTAVGVGGATSMDVTLPIIYASAGPGMVPASFVSGAVLSVSVPVLIPLLFLIK
jgi:uncharacterized membrane protein YbjE (DUF340 family)